MKRSFLLSLTFLLALFISPLNAQVQIGVQAGINLTDAKMDLTRAGFETAMRTRAILGGMISYNFSPVLSLQLEPAYVQGGAAVNAAVIVNGATINAEATISANYFEIPVLLKASFADGFVRPYLLAGASIAFLLGDAKLSIDKATLNGLDVTNLFPSDVREQTFKIKNTNFILNFGGGITIPVGLLNIFIEGHYDLGLIEIVELAVYGEQDVFPLLDKVKLLEPSFKYIGISSRFNYIDDRLTCVILAK